MDIYRKRLLPEELIKLNDTIITQNENVIVTKWEVIRPRPDFDHGCSCYFLKEGFKVSKFIRSDGSLKCWYCDIITYEQNKAGDYIFIDLLADVILTEGEPVQVVDLDELADAFEQNLITKEQMNQALRQLNALLTLIYEGRFGECQKMLENV